MFSCGEMVELELSHGLVESSKQPITEFRCKQRGSKFAVWNLDERNYSFNN
jgi:hypothetical protein